MAGVAPAPRAACQDLSSLAKPPELVEPDPRWQLLHGDRAALEQIAAQWPTSAKVPGEIAEMLRVARDLLVHSYFVYEFGAVAVAWSLIAVEAALRNRVADEASEREPLARVISKAEELGLLRADEVVALDAARKFRNSLAHAKGQSVFSLGMVAPMLAVAHEIVVNLYER